MLWDGQRSPGSHQVVTGVVRETAGLTQRTGSTDTEQQERKVKENEKKGKRKQSGWILQGNRKRL